MTITLSVSITVDSDTYSHSRKVVFIIDWNLLKEIVFRCFWCCPTSSFISMFTHNLCRPYSIYHYCHLFFSFTV